MERQVNGWMKGQVNGRMERQMEELRKRERRICREEDEEDREMDEHYLRLEYMSEDCQDCDQGIRSLIEEQEVLLNILGMRKRGFANEWEKVHILLTHMSCHM